MYCSNCGTKVEENARFCANCGNALNGKEESITNNNSVVVQSVPGSGAATASMVLGILAIIAGIIAFFIAVSISTYVNVSHLVHEYISYTYNDELMVMAIMVIFVPAVLSIIGFCLAISSRGKIKNGSNTAGLVLNIITILLCIAEFVMVAF